MNLGHANRRTSEISRLDGNMPWKRRLMDPHVLQKRTTPPPQVTIREGLKRWPFRMSTDEWTFVGILVAHIV